MNKKFLFFALVFSLITTALLINADINPQLGDGSQAVLQNMKENNYKLKTYEEIAISEKALEEQKEILKKLEKSQTKLTSLSYWALWLAIEISIFYAYFRIIPVIISVIRADKRLATLIVGVTGLIFGFLMDTTVPTGLDYNRVSNIGLMQQQQNLLIVSGIIILISFFMTKTKKSISALEMKKCSYCAESIKKEAVLCRFCSKDV